MLYLAAAILLMVLDQRGQFIPRLRAALGVVVEPVHQLAELPVRGLRSVGNYTRTWADLEDENEALQRQLLEQAGQLQRLASLESENTRLRELLAVEAGQPHRFRFASLADVSLNPISHQVVIDRGEQHGVLLGQAVIDGQGVLGQVDEVRPEQSTVRLISDPNHALPIQVLRTGQRSVAYGSGDTYRLLLPDLPIQSDIRSGDLLVTSGLDGRFPAGFPVAEVAWVERGTASPFMYVEAKPLSLLDRGREVLLVVPEEGPVAPPPPAAGSEDSPVEVNEDAAAVESEDARAEVNEGAPAVASEAAPADVSEGAPTVESENAPSDVSEDAPAVESEDVPADLSEDSPAATREEPAAESGPEPLEP